MVSRWLKGYIGAWQSYDAAAIQALFSEHATYRWHPWDHGDAVAHGREQIVVAWLEHKDRPGSYEAEYEPLAIDGHTAIATGQTRYFDRNKNLKRRFHNMFVLRFDDDGRCAEFTEWYMKAPS